MVCSNVGRTTVLPLKEELPWITQTEVTFMRLSTYTLLTWNQTTHHHSTTVRTESWNMNAVLSYTLFLLVALGPMVSQMDMECLCFLQKRVTPARSLYITLGKQHRLFPLHCETRWLGIIGGSGVPHRCEIKGHVEAEKIRTHFEGQFEKTITLCFSFWAQGFWFLVFACLLRRVHSLQQYTPGGKSQKKTS